MNSMFLVTGFHQQGHGCTHTSLYSKAELVASLLMFEKYRIIAYASVTSGCCCDNFNQANALLPQDTDGIKKQDGASPKPEKSADQQR